MLKIIAIVLKRLGWVALTLWVVFTISWTMMRLAPGGPFDSERKMPPEIERNLRARYGLDQPWHLQYPKDLWQTVWGDFGPSLRLKDYTVNQVIAQGFPVSASLGIMALAFALTVGTTSGVIAAVNRNSVYDVGFMALATLGIASPNFVLAGLAIIVFVFWIPLFPASGWGTVQQLVLPALCLGLPYAAYIARLTRAGMLEVLNLDYIRTAYSKGLAPRTVIVRHALRGAMLPVVSYLAPAMAALITGSLVVERIFNLPGMGSHFIEAALQRDYALEMGVVLVYTLLLSLFNFFVDVSYAIIDPRVKLE
ncbi:MAG: ABC transporter permease subunit [Pirellulaceae bacterium]|nr:ABC transporter permease subunit [Pirellulaceae bacterium]